MIEQPQSPGLAAQLSELIISEPEMSDMLNDSFASLVVSPSENSLLENSSILSESSSPLSSSPEESLASSPLSSRPVTPPPRALQSPVNLASVCVGPIIVRPFQPEDEECIDEIGELCYPPNIEDALSFRAKLYVGDSFVAIDSSSGNIVAYAIGLPWHKEPLHIDESPTLESMQGADVYVVHDVAVHPGCRGGGVASMLLDQLFACARNRQLNKAVLVAINATAKIVWGKKGFSPMTCKADTGGYGPEATKMERYLY